MSAIFCKILCIVGRDTFPPIFTTTLHTFSMLLPSSFSPAMPTYQPPELYLRKALISLCATIR